MTMTEFDYELRTHCNRVMTPEAEYELRRRAETPLPGLVEQIDRDRTLLLVVTVRPVLVATATHRALE